MGPIVLALIFVLAVGLPPARALMPSWSVAVPLAGLTSGIVLSVAAVGSLLSGTALWPWTLGCVAGAWVASAAAVRRRRREHRRLAAAAEAPAGDLEEAPGAGRGNPGVTRLRALAVPALLSAPVLAGTLGPPTEYDARAIWFFRAHWFWEGGDTARAAMGNAAFSYSHADYPPLVPASTAALWALLGRAELAVAQAVTAVQTWLAVLLVAVLVGGLVRRRAELPLAVASGLFVVGCFGVAGGFGTRGYADLLWAAAAVAGGVAALILPVGPGAARLAVVCFATAVLAKGEGIVMVPLLFAPLAALRWGVVAGRMAARWFVGLAGVVALAAGWVAVSSVLADHAQRDITPASLAALLRGDPAKDGRLEPALRGLWGFSRSTLLTAGLVVVVGIVLVGRRRRRRHLGSGLWLPTVAVVAFAVFVVVLAAGELEIDFWVAAGGFRTMTVVRCLLLTEVLVITALALDELLTRPEPAGDGAEADPASIGDARDPRVGLPAGSPRAQAGGPGEG
jgi:hypothetical protein